MRFMVSSSVMEWDGPVEPRNPTEGAGTESHWPLFKELTMRRDRS
jgi:hypothetical protein